MRIYPENNKTYATGIKWVELAARIQVNKNTASYMITRISKAISSEPELLQKLLDCDIY